ncbi:EAL domain-containing protein [Synechococcus sp. CCY 9618]|uniref:sensor domain-containing phosphodiesterase n=1 Tax=Synechococcus sp. CCY 9618 TaxID=2815602 RepID=UPI001C223F53
MNDSLSDFVGLDAESSGTLSDDLRRLLRAIRDHLEMDVAFVSEFTGGQRVFRSIDSSNDTPPIRVGMGHPLNESYCLSVVNGRLPELIPDTADVPETLKFPATLALPVGAHMSVPIRLKDGRVYGTFCCFSFAPNHSLNDRDIKLMRVLSDTVAHRIDQDAIANKLSQDMQQRIRVALATDSLSIAYQPIFDLNRGAVAGFESLARFNIAPLRTPDVWFAEAAVVGSRIELEMKAIGKALEGLQSLPSEVYVSLNVSPESVIRGDVERSLQGMPLNRVVIELTEHTVIAEYLKLAEALAPLREQGVRIAVDDAGAGYASFRHILNLKPNLIKLDIDLTRDIDKDPARQALAAALASFGRDTGSDIVAEGVETASQLRVLRALGVNKAQGYYLGRPVPLAVAMESCPPDRTSRDGSTT